MAELLYQYLLTLTIIENINKNHIAACYKPSFGKCCVHIDEFFGGRE